MRAFVSGKLLEMRELNVVHYLGQMTTFVKVAVSAEISPALGCWFSDGFCLGDDLFADNLLQYFIVQSSSNIHIRLIEETDD